MGASERRIGGSGRMPLTQLSHDEEIFEPRTAGAGAPGRFSVRFRV